MILMSCVFFMAAVIVLPDAVDNLANSLNLSSMA
jgi:hypothetical protein